MRAYAVPRSLRFAYLVLLAAISFFCLGPRTAIGSE